MSTKNVIMKKKIEGVVYDLLVKTSAEQVSYDATHSVAEKIASLITDIGTKANQSDVITAITASATNGKITYTKNGSNTDVSVKGVVVAPTYDSTTRTLTLPVTKADGTTENVVMALGVDLVVKSGTYNSQSKKIILTLTDDSTIEIPASALVDVYTGGTTNSVIVSVDNNNEITAQVRVSAKSGNALSVETEEGKEGLYVEQVDISGKVDKEAGKGLSTEDYTTAEKTKLGNIEAGAQVNTIESVKVNGVALTPDSNKAVDVSTSRILVSATEPAGLTENDLWLQEVTE